MCVPLSLSLCLRAFLSVFVSMCLRVFELCFVSVSVSVRFSACLPVCDSVCVFLSVCLCLWLLVCLLKPSCKWRVFFLMVVMRVTRARV